MDGAPVPPFEGWVDVDGAGEADGSAASATAVPPTANSPTVSRTDAIARRLPESRRGAVSGAGGEVNGSVSWVIDVSWVARSAVGMAWHESDR
jgi:hypothetical protein